MQRSNQTALHTPIIGRVMELNRILLFNGKLAYKIVQHNYVDTMLKNSHLLFRYAMRQVRGKDYKKRAVELAEDIQSDAYLVQSLGGWSMKVCAQIDVLCDEIISQVYKIENAKCQNQ